MAQRKSKKPTKQQLRGEKYKVMLPELRPLILKFGSADLVWCLQRSAGLERRRRLLERQRDEIEAELDKLQ